MVIIKCMGKFILSNWDKIDMGMTIVGFGMLILVLVEIILH